MMYVPVIWPLTIGAWSRRVKLQGGRTGPGFYYHLQYGALGLFDEKVLQDVCHPQRITTWCHTYMSPSHFPEWDVPYCAGRCFLWLKISLYITLGHG